MVRVHPPHSDAVVEIPDTLLDAYVAQGWVAVAAAVPVEVKRPPGRPKKSE